MSERKKTSTTSSTSKTTTATRPEETRVMNHDHSTSTPEVDAVADLVIGVDRAVFETLPLYRRLTVVGSVDMPSKGSSAVREALARSVDATRALIEDVGGDVLAVPSLAAWRSAFRDVEINPSKFRPAVEALVRRAARGDDLALGTTLVDLGTAISLQTLCPVGVHTVDALDPEVEPAARPDARSLMLRFASGTETFTAFDGTVSSPDRGELIYAAAESVLTRRWVWRQGPLGSVRGEAAQMVAVNLDLLDANSDAALSTTLRLLGACGAEVAGVVELSSTANLAGVTW